MSDLALVVGALLTAVSGALLVVALTGQALVRSGTVPKEPDRNRPQQPYIRAAVWAYRTRRWSLLAFILGVALIAVGGGFTGS